MSSTPIPRRSDMSAYSEMTLPLRLELDGLYCDACGQRLTHGKKTCLIHIWDILPVHLRKFHRSPDSVEAVPVDADPVAALRQRFGCVPQRAQRQGAT